MRSLLHAACAAALVFPAACAQAYFESSEIGARALALGHSFVSVADDASAVYWNAAGLVQLRRHEILLSYDRTADLDGLASGFAGLALHTRPASFGFGWQHTNLEGALREDLVYLAAARTLVQRSLGAYVAAGATLKVAHLGLETEGFESLAGLESSATRLCGDLGVLLAPIPNVSAGAVVRNLGRPQFDLLAGGERTTLENEFEWGVSLRWREDGWLHVSRVRHARGDVRTKLAAEVRVAGSLGVRAGYARDAVSGGIGLGWGGWTLDTAFRAHDALGVTYRVALRRGFGSERRGVGNEFDEF